MNNLLLSLCCLIIALSFFSNNYNASIIGPPNYSKPSAIEYVLMSMCSIIMIVASIAFPFINIEFGDTDRGALALFGIIAFVNLYTLVYQFPVTLRLWGLIK